MLLGFQQYLVNKGFKRTCINPANREREENYHSMFLSSYSPIKYDFTDGINYCYWGLCERGKSPVMFLGDKKMHIIQNGNNIRTVEDGYRILFNEYGEDKYDEIFQVFISNNKYFKIDCRDERNIIIQVKEM